ncbi:MAG: hypothetical protein EP329_22470 [Deltaproteobacteria bacterium]|nr:MAG: hypothetical protein EP329_22470 [Deltaproteobacteria bacterium]
MKWIVFVAAAALLGLTGCTSDSGEAADALFEDTCPGAALSFDQRPAWDVSSPGLVVVVEGQTLDLTLTAADADGDFIQYVLAQRPEGMLVNGETGEITWTPDFDTAATCMGSATFQVTYLARTKGPGICGSSEFIDISMRFDVVVLNDLDEDGISDVDAEGARVDPDVDGDGVSYLDEQSQGTDDCVADPAE